MDKNETNLFTWSQQWQFAEASGDYNPIHTDEIASRRTQWGKVLLYGMHLTLWALERAASRGLLQQPFGSFKVRFLKPVFVGETVSAKVTQDGGSASSIQLVAGDIAAVSISINRGTFEPSESNEWLAIPSEHTGIDADQPADLQLEDLPGKSGWVRLRTGAPAMFPSLTEVLGAGRVQALAGISRLVGMTCPGLNSMSYSYRIRFTPDGEEANLLQFQVEDADDRFRLLTQRVRAGGIQGTVVAMVRVPPVRQPRMPEVAKWVKQGEFEGIRAIVIGGSRGLGEVTAKIVAAGGARVVLTYATGLDDALAVRDEIRAWGGICDAVRYDINEGTSVANAFDAKAFNQLYYYATGPIRKRVDDVFSATVFEEFCRFYAEGFHDLCTELSGSAGQVFSVLYPSSKAIATGESSLTEYAMAKAAGECLCDRLNRLKPELRIMVERLPWIRTDQTSGMQDIDTLDAIGVLLPLVRRMSGTQRC